MARVKLRADEIKEERQTRHRQLVNGTQVLLAPQSSYQPEFAELGRLVCLAFGALDAELAQFFKVDVSTIDQWKMAYPEFREACREGKREADLRVVQALYKRAVGFEKEVEEVHSDRDGTKRTIRLVKYYPPDVEAIRFFLRNRQPDHWRAQPEALVQNNLFAKIDLRTMSDDQLDILISRLQAQSNG